LSDKISMVVADLTQQGVRVRMSEISIHDALIVARVLNGTRAHSLRLLEDGLCASQHYSNRNKLNV
jgi:hypothetical protein